LDEICQDNFLTLKQTQKSYQHGVKDQLRDMKNKKKLFLTKKKDKTKITRNTYKICSKLANVSEHLFRNDTPEVTPASAMLGNQTKPCEVLAAN
jgi:hypothetical protein